MLKPYHRKINPLSRPEQHQGFRIKEPKLKHPSHINADIDLLAPHSRHARELFALIQNNLAYLNQWLTWPGLMKTPLDVASFLNTAARHNHTGTALILLLQYQGKLCGVLSYNDFQTEDRSANIGYWLGAAYQGHGIISTALPVLIQHGFQQLGLQQVFIRVAVGNDKSAAIPKRLGFEWIETAHAAEVINQQTVDHQVYVMRKENWIGCE